MMKMTKECAQSICDQFNKRYPTGTLVVLIKDLGEVEHTTTKWPAEVSVNGPVIGLNCPGGKWLLERIIPDVEGVDSCEYCGAHTETTYTSRKPPHQDVYCCDNCVEDHKADFDDFILVRGRDF